KDHLIATLTERLFRESYGAALQQLALRPADDPEINLGELKRDQDFVYVATLQIIPDVKPVGYQGLALTRRVVKITDQDVDLAVDKLREQHVTFVAEPERAAANGDQLLFDFKGFVDGEAFEGGTAEAYLLELGSGRFIPGFEDQLIGALPGEERDVNVTFPEAYGAPGLAGKAALFKCRISEVRVRTLPPVDDGLATLLNIKEGGLTQLREELKASLQKEADAASEKQIIGQIHDQIMAANPLELPQKLVAREQRSMVEQVKKEYQAKGFDPASVGMTDEIIADKFLETANKRVSLGLLLGGIAMQENITVDEERLETEINRIAATYGNQSRNFKKWLQEDQGRMDNMRAGVLEDRVNEWIMQQGVVTDEACSFEELVASSKE
ncbi:MAG: trigger factor, partial [Magnetococcales bacterium]|nr:trigger factor [Magnetococcales bacterium]